MTERNDSNCCCVVVPAFVFDLSELAAASGLQRRIHRREPRFSISAQDAQATGRAKVGVVAGPIVSLHRSILSHTPSPSQTNHGASLWGRSWTESLDLYASV